MRSMVLSALFILALGTGPLAQCDRIVLTEAESAFLEDSCSCSAVAPSTSRQPWRPKGMLDEYPPKEELARAGFARQGFESLVRRGPAFGDCLESLYFSGGTLYSLNKGKGLRKLACKPEGAYFSILRCIAPIRARNVCYKILATQLQLAPTQRPVMNKFGYMNDPPAIMRIRGVVASFNASPDLEPDNQRLARALSPCVPLDSPRIWAEILSLAEKRRDPSFLPLLLDIQQRKDKAQCHGILSVETLDNAVHLLQGDATYFENSFQAALASGDPASEKAFISLKALYDMGRNDIVGKRAPQLFPSIDKNPKLARRYFERFHELGQDDLIKAVQRLSINPDVKNEAANALEWIKTEPERKARLKKISAHENPDYRCP